MKNLFRSEIMSIFFSIFIFLKLYIIYCSIYQIVGEGDTEEDQFEAPDWDQEEIINGNGIPDRFIWDREVVVAVVEVEVEVGVGVIVVMVEYSVSSDMVVAFFDDLYLSLSTACLIVIAMMMMILSC